MFSEPSCLNKVSAFHRVFGHPVADVPCFPLKERCKLRISLIREELDELEKAINDKDLVQVADALGDIQYVLSGTVLEFGFGKNFDNIFSEIHESNMSKVCHNLQQATETIENYEKNGVPAYFKQIGDKFLVYRKIDNKVLKSLYYTHVELTKFVN